MERKEYELGQNKTRTPRRGPMGGGRQMSGEKAKDLVGTWKKILVYCKKYLVVLIIALICAACGTILTLIGPDKLSDMTDTITEGIAPDQDKLAGIVQDISTNMSDNMQTVIGQITANMTAPHTK